MSIQKINKNLLHKILRNITTILLAIMFWQMSLEYQTTIIEKKIPLFFYNIDDTRNILAPTHISIGLKITRDILYSIDNTDISAHINANILCNEKNSIPIHSIDLLLPSSVIIEYYNPCPLEIYVEKNKPKEQNHGTYKHLS